MELMVRLTWPASPEKRLPRLAPSPDRRPCPSEWRRSISAASVGCAHAITWSRSFSYQRKPRMSWLEPCRMPQTLAPVCELQSVCHGVSVWLPSASQAANVGMSPSRIARRTVSNPRPSICRKTTPGGWPASAGAAAWRRQRRVARGEKNSSSSIGGRVGGNGPTPGLPGVATAAAVGAAEEDLVLVDGEQAGDQRADRGHAERDEHRAAEVGDLDAGDRAEHGQRARAEQQEPEDAEGEERQRVGDPHDQRP